MNILFVCTANKERSRTAEIHFQNKYHYHQIHSAGINKYLSERHGGTHIQRYMVELAGRIICFEQCHADYILKKYGIHFTHKITVLHTDDCGNFMTDELIQKITDKIDSVIPYLFLSDEQIQEGISWLKNSIK